MQSLLASRNNYVAIDLLVILCTACTTTTFKQCGLKMLDSILVHWSKKYL